MLRSAFNLGVSRSQVAVRSSSRRPLLSILASNGDKTFQQQVLLFISVPNNICPSIMGKRKSSTLAQLDAIATNPTSLPTFDSEPPPAKRRASGRKPSHAVPKPLSTNPDENANVLDAPGPLRASPDAEENDEHMDLERAGMDVKNQVKHEKDHEDAVINGTESDSPLSEIESPVKPEKETKKAKGKAGAGPKTQKDEETPVETRKGKEPAKESQLLDPDADDMEEADEGEIQAALSRPPPVNSDYLPLPWKGRIGYVYLPVI